MWFCSKKEKELKEKLSSVFLSVVEKKVAELSLSKVIIPWISEISCEGHFQIARSDEVEDNGNHYVQEN